MNAKKKPGPVTRSTKTPSERAGTRVKKRRFALTVLLLLVIGCAGYAVVGQLRGNPDFRAAQEALARRDFKAAQRHLQNYLKDRPNDLEGRLLAAQTERRQGNFTEAAQQLHLCGQQFGASGGLDLERRLLAIQRGDLSDANEMLSYFSQRPDAPETPLVLEAYIEGSLRILRPAYVQELIVAGSESAEQIERTRQAIERWLDLRPLRDDQLQGLIWRHHLHTFEKLPWKAEADIRRAVELDSNHFEARLWLAICLVQENPTEAAAHLQTLHERDPKHGAVCFTLADVRRRLGQPVEAGNLLDKFLEAHPNHVAALVERGRVAVDLQQVDSAEQWFRAALRISPDSPEANLALSRCLRMQGSHKEADEFLETYDRIESAKREKLR